MEAAEREEIVAKLANAFGGAEDVSPGDVDLHVVLPALELPAPWRPSPTRGLTIFTNWPSERPLFYVDPAVVGETGEPPRSHHDAYFLDEPWRGFSWSVTASTNDPVRAIQLWVNRFVEERT